MAAVDRNQFGRKRSSPAVGKRAQQVPERGRHERHPLPLALDDQPHGHALHAAGRKPRPNFRHSRGRDVIAVKAIDDPPDFLGPNQVVVDLARMLPGRRGSPLR